MAMPLVIVSNSLSTHWPSSLGTARELRNQSTPITDISLRSTAPSSNRLKPIQLSMQSSHKDQVYMPSEGAGGDILKRSTHELPKTFHVQKSEPVLIRPGQKTYNGDYYLTNDDHTSMVPMEMLYSFSANGTEKTDNVCEVMTKGLAEVLVHFYPLAGRLAKGPDGKLIVNCTGEGVQFVEASLDCELDEFGDISTPNPKKLRQLLHLHDAKNILDMTLFTVQVTKFKCGGFVLGIVMNHCMMDGASFFMFMNSWAETTRGLPLSVPPFLDRSILKARKLSPSEFLHLSVKYDSLLVKTDGLPDVAPISQEEQMVYKSIEFSHDRLMQLKKTVVEEGISRIPTNFELLTAFLWRALIRSNTRPLKNKVIIPVNAQNILGRIPKGYFGNCLGIAYHVCKTEEVVEMPLSFAVRQLQEALQMVTTEHVQSLAELAESMGAGLSLKNAYVFSDLSRFPFYQADFGWGEPNHFGFATLLKDVVHFLPQKERNKMVAVLGLNPTSVEIFEELIYSTSDY